MELRLYDTLTKEKRVFTPLDPGHVRMYVCGPTVYDFAHIGNARPVIVFDVLFRLLRHLAKQGVWDGGKGETHVTYVRNITDVDDKINDRAARDFPGLPLNEAIRKVTEVTEKQFHEDVDALGCLRPTVEPRATDHIAEMRAIIERLVRGGFAYVAEDHVLFSPQAMNAANSVLPRYGALANRSLDEMIAGARVDVAPYKRDATDFVLWKPSKPGEPSWPSPSGIKAAGRPGWHVECSAMAWKHLGEQFDIHGGGIDLVFPHHENELAQSCCAFHANRMANVWMHNGFLQVEGEKMSKSLGNFVTIRELLETDKFGGRKWPGEVLRLAMLKTHYRSPIDWTTKALEEAEKNLVRWFKAIVDALGSEALRGDWPTLNPRQQLLYELQEDLNLPAIIAGLTSIARSISEPNYAGTKYGVEDAWTFVSDLSLLGLISRERIGFVFDFVQGRTASLAQNEYNQIEKLIADRTAARACKDFKESDRIRDELAGMGVVIKDSKEGTTWEIAR